MFQRRLSRSNLDKDPLLLELRAQHHAATAAAAALVVQDADATVTPNAASNANAASAASAAPPALAATLHVPSALHGLPPPGMTPPVGGSRGAPNVVVVAARTTGHHRHPSTSSLAAPASPAIPRDRDLDFVPARRSLHDDTDGDECVGRVPVLRAPPSPSKRLRPASAARSTLAAWWHRLAAVPYTASSSPVAAAMSATSLLPTHSAAAMPSWTDSDRMRDRGSDAEIDNADDDDDDSDLDPRTKPPPSLAARALVVALLLAATLVTALASTCSGRDDWSGVATSLQAWLHKRHLLPLAASRASPPLASSISPSTTTVTSAIPDDDPIAAAVPPQQPPAWRDTAVDLEDLGMDAQCTQLFGDLPQLHALTHESSAFYRARGGLTRRDFAVTVRDCDLRRYECVRVQILDGTVYVVEPVPPAWQSRALAALLLLQDAVDRARARDVQEAADWAMDEFGVVPPTSANAGGWGRRGFPDIDVMLHVGDYHHTDYHYWSFSRPVGRANGWVMPEYSLLAWPEAGLRTWTQTAAVLDAIGTNVPWEAKRAALVWRGGNLDVAVRRSLVNAAAGFNRTRLDIAAPAAGDSSVVARGKHKHVAVAAQARVVPDPDPQRVPTLRKRGPLPPPSGGARATTPADASLNNVVDRAQYLSMADQCARFRYLLYTEGWAHSGRLKYQLLCQSAIVAHQVHFREHFYPLLENGTHWIEMPSREWSELPRVVEALVELDERDAREVSDRRKKGERGLKGVEEEEVDSRRGQAAGAMTTMSKATSNPHTVADVDDPHSAVTDSTATNPDSYDGALIPESDASAPATNSSATNTPPTRRAVPPRTMAHNARTLARRIFTPTGVSCHVQRLAWAYRAALRWDPFPSGRVHAKAVPLDELVRRMLGDWVRAQDGVLAPGSGATAEGEVEEEEERVAVPVVDRESGGDSPMPLLAHPLDDAARRAATHVRAIRVLVRALVALRDWKIAANVHDARAFAAEYALTKAAVALVALWEVHAAAARRAAHRDSVASVVSLQDTGAALSMAGRTPPALLAAAREEQAEALLDSLEGEVRGMDRAGADNVVAQVQILAEALEMDFFAPPTHPPQPGSAHHPTVRSLLEAAGPAAVRASDWSTLLAALRAAATSGIKVANPPLLNYLAYFAHHPQPPRRVVPVDYMSVPEAVYLPPHHAAIVEFWWVRHRFAAVVPLAAVADALGDDLRAMDPMARDLWRQYWRGANSGDGVWRAGDLDTIYDPRRAVTPADLARALPTDTLYDTSLGDMLVWRLLGWLYLALETENLLYALRKQVPLADLAAPMAALQASMNQLRARYGYSRDVHTRLAALALKLIHRPYPPFAPRFANVVDTVTQVHADVAAVLAKPFLQEQDRAVWDQVLARVRAAAQEWSVVHGIDPSATLPTAAVNSDLTAMAQAVAGTARALANRFLINPTGVQRTIQATTGSPGYRWLHLPVAIVPVAPAPSMRIDPTMVRHVALAMAAGTHPYVQLVHGVTLVQGQWAVVAEAGEWVVGELDPLRGAPDDERLAVVKGLVSGLWTLHSAGVEAPATTGSAARRWARMVAVNGTLKIPLADYIAHAVTHPAAANGASSPSSPGGWTLIASQMAQAVLHTAEAPFAPLLADLVQIDRDAAHDADTYFVSLSRAMSAFHAPPPPVHSSAASTHSMHAPSKSPVLIAMAPLRSSSPGQPLLRANTLAVRPRNAPHVSSPTSPAASGGGASAPVPSAAVAAMHAAGAAALNRRHTMSATSFSTRSAGSSGGGSVASRSSRRASAAPADQPLDSLGALALDLPPPPPMPVVTDSGDAWSRALAFYRHGQGDVAAALTLFMHASTSEPAALFYAAEILYYGSKTSNVRQDPARAADLYARALSRGVDVAHVGLGDAAYFAFGVRAQPDRAKAADHYAHALALDWVDDPDVHPRRTPRLHARAVAGHADCLHDAGDLDEARKAFLHAVALDPGPKREPDVPCTAESDDCAALYAEFAAAAAAAANPAVASDAGADWTGAAGCRRAYARLAMMHIAGAGGAAKDSLAAREFLTRARGCRREVVAKVAWFRAAGRGQEADEYEEEYLWRYPLDF
ncbi:hypothetical protein GGF31_004582 [Allomyces arbusculus]|nr:hypothetical protein GGF31_004582 [Allomyces arbusculus]